MKRQMDGWRDRQTDEETGRQTDEETGRQDRCRNRQTVEEKTDKGRDRKIDGKIQIENCPER